MKSVRPLTQYMLDKLPMWMKMKKDPESIGAQFLDVFGINVENVSNYLEEEIESFYLETLEVDVIDWVYCLDLASEHLIDIKENAEVILSTKTGQEIYLEESPTLRHFYSKESIHGQKERFIIDDVNGWIYIRPDLDNIEDWDNPYAWISVNGAKQYDVRLHPIWNGFDEFGFLFGLRRLPKERNEAFKNRILSIFTHPGTSTREGVKNGLSRELGISSEEIQIYGLLDRDAKSILYKENGDPSETFFHYAKEMNRHFRETWKELNFDEAYWFSLEETDLGIHYLPHRWNLEEGAFQEEDFQSGVGEDGDLVVSKPQDEERIRPFKAYIGLMGYFEKTEESHPELHFRYKLYAKGKIPNKEYKEENFRYTVKATKRVSVRYRVYANMRFSYRHRVDYYDVSKMKDDGNLVYGKSNDFLHALQDPIVRLHIKMDTSNSSFSPSIQELNLVYEDTAGVEQRCTLTAGPDFENDKTSNSGLPFINIETADTYVNEVDGQLELGFGDFYRDYTSTADWDEGEFETGSILIQDGDVKLNLEKYRVI